MRPFDYFGPARLRHAVEEGRVACPVHGHAVDAHQCTTCSYLREAVTDDDGRFATVVCAPPLAELAGPGRG